MNLLCIISNYYSNRSNPIGFIFNDAFSYSLTDVSKFRITYFSGNPQGNDGFDIRFDHDVYRYSIFLAKTKSGSNNHFGFYRDNLTTKETVTYWEY